MVISKEKINKFAEKMLKRILLLFFCLPTLLFSQTLKGIVTDKNNAPIEAVNISIMGSKGGISTNHLGEYQLNIKPNRSFVISFSFFGYNLLKFR